MNPHDGTDLRRLCLRLSVVLRTGYDYFVKLPIREVIETAKEAEKVGKRKRVRARD